MAKNSKNRMKSIKETLLLLLIIVIVGYALFRVANLIIKPTNTFMVQNGEISNEKDVVGYVIREEKVVKGENYKNGIAQIKSEGEKVSAGTKVFRYYASNEKNINQKISELNKEIQEALSGQNFAFLSDVKSIENQIDVAIENVKMKNNIQEIQEYKKNIDTYITKKAKILGNLSSSSTYINELIASRENYQKQLDDNSEIIISPSSGVISYRVDGLEDVLNSKNFDNITEKSLQDLNLRTGQIISTSTEEAKIVNNYCCYIAIILENEETDKIKKGSRVKIRLSNQDEVYSTIENIKEDNNRKIIILKIKKDVEYLINYRKISLEIIWWSEEGLKVPNSSIIYDQGLSYVVRSRLGYLDKILVEIKQSNEDYSIINNYDSEGLKELGYTTTEIGNMKKISLYDEILVKPDLDKI